MEARGLRGYVEFRGRGRLAAGTEKLEETGHYNRVWSLGKGMKEWLRKWALQKGFWFRTQVMEASKPARNGSCRL